MDYLVDIESEDDIKPLFEKLNKYNAYVCILLIEMAVQIPKNILGVRLNNLISPNSMQLINESQVLYQLHGLSFGDFTRTGKVGLWNIYKFLEVDRIIPSFIIGENTKNDVDKVYGVVGATQGHFSKTLYKMAALAMPMTCSATRGSVGRTSFTIIIEARSDVTGEFLARVTRQVVRIDPVSRRPKPLPEIYHAEGNTKASPFKVETYNRPQTFFHVYMYTVAASDMDHLYHVNQGIYHKYCLDAAYDAGKVGFLQNFHWDICEYEVAEVSARHTGEAHAGDRLEVCVWEPVHDTLSLMFEIRKQDKVIFSSVLRFHSLNNSHL